MKKVLLIMAAALMTMTQCRKQETMPAMPSADTVKMTITAGPGRTDINTTDGSITWSEGDKLYVSNGATWLGSLTLVGNGGSAQGTFTGSIASIGDGVTTCHFFYLGHDNGMTEPAGTAAASISFAAQDGTLADAMKYHIGYGNTDVTVAEGAAAGYVIMNTKIAIAHLNLTTADSHPYTGAVTMGGTDISNTMTVSPDGTFSGSGDGGITIDKGNGTTGDRYVTLIPATTPIVNAAFTGDATGSMTFLAGIRENKFYGMSEAIAVRLETTATHEYVDLGLSVNWATCNIGANRPEDYGNYYAWGETETKSIYDWSTYKWCNGSNNSLTKYNTNSTSGTVDNKTVLDPEDDAASANWGGDWRMPTVTEFEELISNTTGTWYGKNNTEFNGVAGYKYVSKKEGYTDKYIFLPATSYSGDGTGLNYYWSSSLNSDPCNAKCMCFTFIPGYDNTYWMDDHLRSSGQPVRPVCSGS